jgi:hypothetical protein
LRESENKFHNVDSSQVGLVYVRGCEVEGMLDENGRVIEEGPEPKPQLPGEKRTFRVLLDCNQYHADMVRCFAVLVTITVAAELGKVVKNLPEMF